MLLQLTEPVTYKVFRILSLQESSLSAQESLWVLQCPCSNYLFFGFYGYKKGRCKLKVPSRVLWCYCVRSYCTCSNCRVPSGYPHSIRFQVFMIIRKLTECTWITVATVRWSTFEDTLLLLWQVLLPCSNSRVPSQYPFSGFFFYYYKEAHWVHLNHYGYCTWITVATANWSNSEDTLMLLWQELLHMQ